MESATMEGPSGNSVSSQPSIGRFTRSMIPNKFQTKRKIEVAKSKVKAKPRLRVTARDPVRLTSCIFPQPVTIITKYPENQTRYTGEEVNLKKPQQLCALKRVQKQVGDSKGDLSCPLELANPVERIALRMQNEANNQSDVKDQLTPGEVTSVQPPCSENTEQVALRLPASFSSQGVTLPVPLHLLPSHSTQNVTTADIRRQTRKVKRARKRLAEALEADRLAKQAVNMRE